MKGNDLHLKRTFIHGIEIGNGTAIDFCFLPFFYKSKKTAIACSALPTPIGFRLLKNNCKKHGLTDMNNNRCLNHFFNDYLLKSIKK
jgi:hypothetical protein